MYAIRSYYGWNPSAQNVAKSVVIEAAELLEHFQWDNKEEDLKKKNFTEIGFEIVDVMWYLFILVDKLDIDLIDAISHKLNHNEQKYPAEMFNGKHNSSYNFV